MAWESRNGVGRYYTKSERVNGRVVRHYYGSGQVGQLAFELDQLEKLDREAKSEEWRQQKQANSQIAEELKEMLRVTKIFIDASLILSGYHQHNRGEWRKKRDKS